MHNNGSYFRLLFIHLSGASMKNFYFVGGASGVGKTSIMAELKDSFKNTINIYDFDDIGVPKDADKKWRQESTEKWLLELLKDDKDVCLLGQIVLGEILACPSAKMLGKINFCLLDVSDYERISRLKKRNTYGIDQNMLNWSSWLRMHHQDPQWVQHVLKEGCWPQLNFNNWDQLENWGEKAFVTILDTTNLTIQQVALSITKWIKENSYC